MRVDMTFDQQKVEQQGYTLAAVRPDGSKELRGSWPALCSEWPGAFLCRLWQRG